MEVGYCKMTADYISNANAFRNGIFNKFSSGHADLIWLNSSLKDIKRVAVIAAGSRSGSSLLFSILRRAPGVYSLSGESTPFYKLNGLSLGAFSSDEIPQDTVISEDQWRGLSRDFLSDSASDSNETDILPAEETLDRYIDELALRFCLEWPAVSFSCEVFGRLARRAFRVYTKAHSKFSREEFYLELLWMLRQEYDVINPYYYDIPAVLIQNRFPGLEIPCGPPSRDIVIEEPPFILLSPRKKMQKADLSGKMLLLKTSADCYRMPFLETIFPGADFKIIHLTRNPVASINGLYDGWLHRGFFSHNLSAALKSRNSMLKIAGYSERYEWGKWWWKYDLPGRWEDYTQKRLEEVCAFQWCCSNKALLEYFKKSRKEYYRVRYEDIIGGLESRKEEIEGIVKFLGINVDAVGLLGLDKLAVVQATDDPQPYRWKKRKDLLLPLLNDPQLSGISEELNYSTENIKEWF